MKQSRHAKIKLDEYIIHVEEKQRNTLWPDVLRGGRAVDEVFWKGRRDAPLIQRVGVVIVALVILVSGLFFLSETFAQHCLPCMLVALSAFAITALFFRSALRH